MVNELVLPLTINNSPVHQFNHYFILELPNELFIDQFFAKISTLSGIHSTVDS